MFTCLVLPRVGGGGENIVAELNTVHIPCNRHIVLYVVPTNYTYGNKYALHHFTIPVPAAAL